jgi:hypothetical protein
LQVQESGLCFLFDNSPLLGLVDLAAPCVARVTKEGVVALVVVIAVVPDDGLYGGAVAVIVYA